MHSALVTNHQGILNQENVVFCVGNGFIRSERWMNTRGSLNGNGSLFQHFSIQRASHKNVTGRNG